MGVTVCDTVSCVGCFCSPQNTQPDPDTAMQEYMIKSNIRVCARYKQPHLLCPPSPLATGITWLLHSLVCVCVCVYHSCGNGVVKSSGCNKMKCRCGYRFCYVCGIENALCGHTPASHGYIDNITGRGDFSHLRDKTSRT